MPDDVDPEALEDLTNQLLEVGLSPTAGRILAWLLLAHEGDYSSMEIADASGVSRGAISTQTQVLASRGMLVRFRKTGSREVYFRPEPRLALDLLLQVGRLAGRLREIAQRQQTPGEGSRRLDEFIEVSAFVERRVPEVVAELDRETAGLP